MSGSSDRDTLDVLGSVVRGGEINLLKLTAHSRASRSIENLEVNYYSSDDTWRRMGGQIYPSSQV